MADGETTYRVLVHNDNATPMDFVVRAFHEVFDYGEKKSARLMLRVHHHGVAEVARLPQEEALKKVDQLQALAAKAGHPLTASVSPATEPVAETDGPTYTLDVSGLSNEQIKLVRALIHELSSNRR